jgi:Protein of unknown function (DUF3800)
MPPRFQLGFIRELCIALHHRWIPSRLFVILTAYLDESGTHTGSPVTVVGGVLANARQWSNFEKRFRAAKKKHGFDVFRTKNFKDRSGKFSGWSNAERVALIDDLSVIATDELFVCAASMAISNDEDRAIMRDGNAPKKVRLPSAYGLCIQECLWHFALEAERRKSRGRLPVLHVVCESGHKNAGDAERIFGDLKTTFKEAGLEVLGTITFAGKDVCDPLMLADFIVQVRFLKELGKIKSFEKNDPTDVPSHRIVYQLFDRPGGLENRKNSLIDALKKRR